MSPKHQIVHFAINKPTTKNLILSACIPAFIWGIALIRKLLEYYFRLSKEYRWIYSHGTALGFFLQMAILLFSIGFSIYLIAIRKEFNSTLIWAISLLLSISPITFLLVTSFI